MNPPRVRALVLGILLLGFLPLAHAQEGPQNNGRELQFWSGGGYGVKGIALHTGVSTLGIRYGWILTGPHGPGPLRGRFEYVVDVVPVFVVFQPINTAYGAALNPLGLKWNFDTHKRIVPYAELSGGTLYTNQTVSPGASRINFASSGGVGLQFLTKKAVWTADVRFMHISNAGLTALNPGVNTVQVRIGIGWFTHRRD
jgi:hypothetical protein